MKKLTSKKYWDSGYSKLSISDMPSNGPLETWLVNVINECGMLNKSVFEIGCFPGSYLRLFGDYNCILSGVDITTRTLELKNNFLAKNYQVGSITKGDIFTLKNQHRYDVVCSFGFIEHFDDWKSVVNLHSQLLNESGYLIITVPNFSGIFQLVFHLLVDGKNLSHHNIKVMNLGILSRYLTEQGFKIVKSEAIGSYTTWFDNPHPNYIQRKIIKFYQEKLKSLEKRGTSPKWSPYLGVVAKRI